MDMKDSEYKFKGFIKGKIYLILSILLIGILCSLWTASIKAAEREEKIIRVAFPIQPGLTEVQADGGYIGYTYDYLMEISQYTNWKYEFVQVEGDLDTQINTLLEMLLKGEVDLMGAMLLNEQLASMMDYAGYNYGTAYSALYALDENTEINSSNYMSFPKLRIAVIKTSKVYNQKLEQFAEMNGLEIETILCETEVEQMEMLKQKKADLLFSIDISSPGKGLRTIARFAPEPFYFATTKGNTDIVNALNTAISIINEGDPYFMALLHERYFSMESENLYLSEAEKEYIKQHYSLKVLMAGENAPIQYKDKETNEIKGISKNVLDYISDKTGIEFEIFYAESIEEYQHILETENINLISGIITTNMPNYYHEEYSYSISYVELPTNIVINKNVNPSELSGKRQIVLNSSEYKQDYDGTELDVDTVEEALILLNEGKGDYFHGNSYAIQYYMNSLQLKNIIMLPQTDDIEQKVRFGIMNPVDTNLISIINKTIRDIPEGEMRNFLYENAFQMQNITLLSYIRSNPEHIILGTLVVTMICICIFLGWYAYSYKKSNEKSKLENLRYEQIGELTNEYIFEYDITQDRLKMPEKCAKFLEVEKTIENMKEIQKENQRIKEKEKGDRIGLFVYIASVQEGSKEINFQFKSGEKHWLKVISKKVLDKNGNPAFCVGKIVDIQKEKEKQEQLLKEAKEDSLTGIYNAATSHEMITESLLQGEKKQAGALFIIDIDYFKNVNDNYGHYTGDYVLIALAKILTKTFRNEDIVGRLGGDEFLVFMKGVQEKEILIKKCDIICEKVQEILIEGKQGNISVSMGVYLAEVGEAYNEVYKKADQALYNVKKRGRNGYEII